MLGPIIDLIYLVGEAVGGLFHLGTRPRTRVPVLPISREEVLAQVRLHDALLVDLRYGTDEKQALPNALHLPSAELLAGSSASFKKLEEALDKVPVVFFDLNAQIAMDAVLQAGLKRGRLFASSVEEVRAAQAQGFK